MNLSIITAQIINQPKLVRFNNVDFIYMVVCIPNDIKKLSFYKVQIYGKLKKGQDFFSLYRQKDFIIITGFLYIRKGTKQNLNNRNSLIIKFEDIQSCITKIE
uniref:Single-stranded DNA binding protein n=1 Tax=Antithamnion hubbsii TaxID=1005974 RepID=A0A4D6WKC9_9FLOR|nr:hypothetical protein [Antithamnion hubbsii]